MGVADRIGASLLLFKESNDLKHTRTNPAVILLLGNLSNHDLKCYFSILTVAHSKNSNSTCFNTFEKSIYFKLVNDLKEKA